MNQPAKKSKEENYQPNPVPRAFKAIMETRETRKELFLSSENLEEMTQRHEPEIDLMTLVQLPARDLKRTVRFYVDVLGMALDYPERPLEVNSFVSTIPRIGPGLHILTTQASEFRHLHAVVNGDIQEYLAIYVKDIQSLFGRLQQAGAQIEREPLNGYMSFFDPEGHLIGVYERLASEINEKFESNVTGFRHIQMLVSDIETTKVFFEKALGFKEETSVQSALDECYLSFREGYENQPLLRLVLMPEESVQPMHWILDGRPKHACELHSKDIRSLREQTLLHGGVVKEELEFTGCGGYLKFYTPENHYIWVNQDRHYCDY